MSQFLIPLLLRPGRWGLRIERTGEWLIPQVDPAVDSASRRQGLLGRDGLAEDTGLIIAPTQGVHTFGMRFAIDIVAVRRDGEVVKWRDTVPPRRIMMALRAYAFLELPAGTAARAGLQAGDRLVVDATPDSQSRRRG